MGYIDRTQEFFPISIRIKYFNYYYYYYSADLSQIIQRKTAYKSCSLNCALPPLIP